MSNRDECLSWSSAAFQKAVVRRSLGFALVVGPILILINHGTAILEGDVTPARLLRMGLTVMVPYLVSTWSSVLALRSPGGNPTKR